MMTPKPPEALDYSPRQRFGFIRRHRWKIWALVFLGIGAFCYLKFDTWGKPVWDRLALLHYQRQCMAFEAPAGQVVLEEDPVEAVKLLATGGYNREPRDTGGAAATWTAPARARLEQLLPPRTVYDGYAPGGTVILHERCTPGGRHVLVVLDIIHFPSSLQPDSFGFRCDLITPASMFSPLSLATFGPFNKAFSPQVVPQTWTVPVRLIAGQIDSDDPGRFTIEYQAGTRHGIIDGWLEDTAVGPAVHLHYRDAKSMSRHVLLEYYDKCCEFEPSDPTAYSNESRDVLKLHASTDEYELDVDDGPARVFLSPRVWSETGFAPETRTVFLHELQTTTGERRLVQISPLLESGARTGIGGLLVNVVVRPTATSIVVPAKVDTMWDRSVQIPSLMDAKYILFGECDPKHADCFSLWYGNDAGPNHIIQGRLLEDARHVELKLEDGTVFEAGSE